MRVTHLNESSGTEVTTTPARTPPRTIMGTGTGTEAEPFIFYGVPMERVISRFGFDAIMSVSLIAAEFLCLMGVATNVINIVVFVRLGLRETTNISMLSLAVSDLLQCAIGLWCCLLYIPAFRNAEKSFRWVLFMIRILPRSFKSNKIEYKMMRSLFKNQNRPKLNQVL